MIKYVLKADTYKKASGSCRSYKGKKATLYLREFENKKQAEEWAEELKKQLNPYKHYENIIIEKMEV